MDTSDFGIFPDFMPQEQAEELLQEALNGRGWTKQKEVNGGYGYFSRSLTDRSFRPRFPSNISKHMESLLQRGAALIEDRFCCVLGEHFTVTCSKMLQDQYMPIHHDSPVGGRGVWENYRQLFYFDRHYEEGKGGLLCLFGTNNRASVVAAVRPIFNTCVIMRLSEQSWHAVSRIRSGERLSLVISYWGYPLLFAEQRLQSMVKEHLRWMIDNGFEKIEVGPTSLLNCRYHTFRTLHSWELSASTVLAGLVHRGGNLRSAQESKLWSSLSATERSNVSAVLACLEHNDGAFNYPAAVQTDALLVKLAELLEEVTCDEKLTAAIKAVSSTWDKIPKAVMPKVQSEIATIRAQLADPDSCRNRKR